MKRVCQIFCISLFVLALATTAMATGTRVMTMGNQDMFITDDANIWHWTSTVNNYPSHMIADVESAEWDAPTSTSGDTRVGMIMPFMGDGVLGVFVSDANANWNPYFNGVNPRSFDNRVDLFWGKRMSNMDLGIHLEWWGGSDKLTATNSSSVVGLAAGVAMNQGGNMMEFNAFFRKLSFTNEAVGTGPAFDTNNVQDAGSHVGFAWRWMRSQSSSTTLIPAISFDSWKLSETLLPTGQNAEEIKMTTIDVGVGCNVVPLSGTEFLGSIGFEYTKLEQGDTSLAGNIEQTTLAFPYVKFGADIQVKPWLNFRVGVQKAIYSKTTTKDLVTTANPDRVQTSSDFDFKLGTGIMLGDVQFDFDLNTDFLFNGPYLVSGAETDPLWMYASFKYDYR